MMTDQQKGDSKPPVETDSAENKTTKGQFRCILAYWILGLCNNYGYVVMLTAANDIIDQSSDSNNGTEQKNSTERECTHISTGTILLADIIPALIIKLLVPFFPFMVHIQVAACVIIAASGFLSVAFGQTMVLSILGVVLTSLSSGLGEATFLQYSSLYQRNVVSGWSSGTGGAGVIGASSYSLLHYVGMQNTMLLMLIVPLFMSITFWIILPKPSQSEVDLTIEDRYKINEPQKKSKVTVIEKIRLIPGLLKYMIPFGLVYLFEYFINQGTFELIEIKNSSVPQDSQYRWLQVTYQVGVFASRSSVNFLHIKKIWIMAALQAINVIIFTTEAIYYYIPNFYIVVALVLWEGLLGGSSYVNTYYRITNEVSVDNKQFSMAITGFSDSIGISLAGVIAIFAHNAICDLPLPK